MRSRVAKSLPYLLGMQRSFEHVCRTSLARLAPVWLALDLWHRLDRSSSPMARLSMPSLKRRVNLPLRPRLPGSTDLGHTST